MSSAGPREAATTATRWMRSWLGRYGFAVVMVAIATALGFALHLLGPFQSTYILFFPAIVVIAMWAGFWPGIVGTLLAALFGDYFFVEPRYSFAVQKPEDVLGPALFSIIGVSLTLLTCSRTKATQALKESEADLKRAQAVAHIGSWRLDVAKNVMSLSDEAYRIIGLHPGEPVSVEQTIGILHPDDRERVVREWTGALMAGSYEGEDRVLVQGKTRWIHVQAKVECNREGGAQAILGTVQDITERKQTEVALREREEHFQILVEQASDGIFITDLAGRYLDVNSAGAEMLGYTRGEILRLSISQIVAEEEVPRIVAELARLLEGETVRSDWKFRRKDGSFFPGEVCAKRLPDGRLQGILRDMTERKRAEEILQRSEERFRVALKDSPITVFSQDRDLRYTWIYNPHLYWQKEIIGKSDDEIIGAERARSLVDLKGRVLEAGAGMREEVVIAHNGTKHSFDVTIEPLFDSERNVIGITGASMDIARLRELADRLHETKEKLAQEKLYLESEIETELGFEEIVGQSSSLREVLRKTRVVAPTDSTVLLLGETGTGKELVARSVHTLSPRHDQSFIKLNCAAVPSGLLESELFGHEKGAFTGAVNQKVGRLELADKGTLFLDEVGELPLELQPKLLRVLQDREFERLGGVRTVQVDVRIISATNRDLQKDVAEKRFREDLFYRLNVFPLRLPPLRDRRSDIPVLVHHFVRKHAGRMGRQIELIPNETMRVLQNWNWPGNIRELENMIERMVILSKGQTLAPPPAELHEPQGLGEDDLTEMEREHIIRILRETHGVLSGPEGAANRLGIKRTTLQSMLKRFDIEVQDFRRGTGTFGPD
jgi:PAS domain S-box-containing protein